MRTNSNALLRAEIREISNDSKLRESQRQLLKSSLESSKLTDEDLWLLARRLRRAQSGGGWATALLLLGIFTAIVGGLLVYLGFDSLYITEHLSIFNSVGASLLLTAICLWVVSFSAIEGWTTWAWARSDNLSAIEREIRQNLPPEKEEGKKEPTKEKAEE